MAVNHCCHSQRLSRSRGRVSYFQLGNLDFVPSYHNAVIFRRIFLAIDDYSIVELLVLVGANGKVMTPH
jgi:hypothetical protein